MIKVLCGDGSDNHCDEFVNVRVPGEDYLNGTQLRKLQSLVKKEDSKRQRHSDLTVSMSLPRDTAEKILTECYEYEQDDIDSMPITNGEMEVEFVIRHDICSFCGSDQDYDAEGNNVTGA